MSEVIPETDREREIAHQKYAEGYTAGAKSRKGNGMFSIAGQSLGITVRVRLERNFYNLSMDKIDYPKGTCFNLLTDEKGYVMVETLDNREVLAIDYGEFTILWVEKGERP